MGPDPCGVVEIDPNRVLQIVDYAASTTAASAFIHRSSKARVMGATAQALGAAGTSRSSTTEDGNLLTPNFYDYHCRTHSTCAAPHRVHREPIPFTPLARRHGEGGAPASTRCARAPDALRGNGDAFATQLEPYQRVWEMRTRLAGGHGGRRHERRLTELIKERRRRLCRRRERA